MSAKGKAARWQVELLKLRADLAIAREALERLTNYDPGFGDMWQGDKDEWFRACVIGMNRLASAALAKIGEGSPGERSKGGEG